MGKIELTHCMDLDANDPLRELRSEFLLAETGSIHFDANSMGAMPKTVPEKVAWMLNEGWRNLGRQGWSKLDWIDQPKKLGNGIAHLLGAQPEDVVVCDNTSINLHKLISYAWGIKNSGNILLTESNHFPTDVYIAEGWIKPCLLILNCPPQWGSGQAITASVVIQSLASVNRCLAGSNGSKAARG